MSCDELPSLQAHGVSVRRHGRLLINEVDLALRAGEVLALLGANGAGKTTLLKTMAGETPPCAGHVCLNGHRLHHVPSRERARRIAILPQHLDLSFPLTGIEVALLGRIPYHLGPPSTHDRTLVLECMERVDALHLADRPYPTLSGGERARVQLARVLAQVWEGIGGRYLLLDEPSAPLDIAHQIELMRILREVAARGIGVMLIVHDLNLSLTWADRVALLKQGRLIAVGRPEEVVTVELIKKVFDVIPYIARHPLHGGPWLAFSPDPIDWPMSEVHDDGQKE